MILSAFILVLVKVSYGQINHITEQITPGPDCFFEELMSTHFNQPMLSECKQSSTTTQGSQTNTPSTPTGCTCVPYYQCLNKDGSSAINTRKTEKKCRGNWEICCPSPSKESRRTPETTSTPTPTSVCGNRNVNGLSYRLMGNRNEAQYGEFPWMAAVIYYEYKEDTKKYRPMYQCGGSLIHPSIVLTAAHCVKGKDELSIRVGEWDTQTKNEEYDTQDRSVSQVIIHEDFRGDNMFNDIALLVLKSAVNMSQPNVGTICLPEANENIDGRNCVASGWGKNEFGSKGKFQVILKKTNLQTVPRVECESSLQETKLGKHFRLNRSFICAGGIVGQDTCDGDGGSPLVCPSRTNPSQYVQAGIVSWGIDCGTTVPGVYTNIPLFVPWINAKLAQLNML